ncbi:MAG: lipopolysaccharide biosynthesis protein [Haloplasmataceae bacterium]|jgi:capsular polysaccharide biosynthesis protein|nr:lipopolysaccharide biosynthesis protein [Haloplasmataceae bacterium]
MENNNIETVDSINLQELFLVLWKNVIFIAILTIISAAAFGSFTKFFMEKEYASDTYVQISSSQHGGTYTDLQYSKALVKNYVFQANSRTVLNQVINDEALNLSMGYDELKNLVKVSQITDTDIIKIEVTTNDSQLSADIANKVSYYLTEFVKTDVNVLDVRPYDAAIQNTNSVGPNLMLNTVIGLVMGGMISVGIVLLKEFLNRTVRTSKDVEKYLNLPVLGAIPMLEKKYID